MTRKAALEDRGLIDRIINPNKAAEDEVRRKRQTSRFEDSINDFRALLDITENKIAAVDCTQVVLDWIEDLPLGKASLDFLKKSQKEVEKANVKSLISTVKTSIEDTALGPQCALIAKWFDLITTVLDEVVKLAARQFKKIDKLRKDIEAFITEFLLTIRDCFLKVIRDASIALTTIVENVVDLSPLAALMDRCPCLKEIVFDMLPFLTRNCNVNDSGATILNCIEANINIGDFNLTNGINQWIQDNVIDLAILAFNEIDKFIKRQIDYLMKPFRWLIKQYCKLINEHLLTGVPDSCVFETSIKYEGNKRVRGMSVLDMMKTMKGWSSCFMEICSTFSDEARIQILEYNENLRLSIEHWLGPAQMDIYWTCIAIENMSDSKKKELDIAYAPPPLEDSIDAITALQGKKLTEPLDTVLEDLSTESIDPQFENIKFENGADDEFYPIKQGHIEFYAGVEDTIVDIIGNIGSVINQFNYSDRFDEILKWEFNFLKNENHLNTVNTIKNNIVIKEGDDDPDPENYNIYLNVLPTYEIVDDYSDVDFSSSPTKEESESTLDYYTRWYNSVVS